MDFERILGAPFFHSSSQTITARFNSALLQTVVRKSDRAQARSFQLQPVFSYLGAVHKRRPNFGGAFLIAPSPMSEFQP